MKKIEIPERFDKFLRKNKIRTKFIKNYDYKIEPIDSFFKNTDEQDYVLDAFYWDDVPEYHTFWSGIDELWRLELQDKS